MRKLQQPRSVELRAATRVERGHTQYYTSRVAARRKQRGEGCNLDAATGVVKKEPCERVSISGCVGMIKNINCHQRPGHLEESTSRMQLTFLLFFKVFALKLYAKVKLLNQLKGIIHSVLYETIP